MPTPTAAYSSPIPSASSASSLFRGEGGIPCRDAADGNDDGRLNITDPVFLLGFLFRGSTPPPEPHGSCGRDPTEDELDCSAFPACSGASEFEEVASSFGILRTLAGKGEISTPDVNDEQLAYVSSRSRLVKWTPAGGARALPFTFEQLGAGRSLRQAQGTGDRAPARMTASGAGAFPSSTLSPPTVTIGPVET